MILPSHSDGYARPRLPPFPGGRFGYFVGQAEGFASVVGHQAGERGFVTIVGITSVWPRGSAFAYVAFALFTTGYFLVFWKRLADATDRRAAVHVAEALGLTHVGASLPRPL